MATEIDSKAVFISHAHKEDAAVAHRLAEDLITNGHRPWIAPDSIYPGEQWVMAIQRGLDESTAFVVVLTPAAVISKWVELETSIGIRRAVDENRLFIPLDFRQCLVPTIWGMFQFVSFRESYESGLQNLLTRLSPKQSPKGTPAEIPAKEVVLPKVSSMTLLEAIGKKIKPSLLGSGTKVPPVNPEAALYKFAQAKNFGTPQSDEFSFTDGTGTYIGQLYSRAIVYLKAGYWGNVMCLEKPWD